MRKGVSNMYTTEAISKLEDLKKWLGIEDGSKAEKMISEIQRIISGHYERALAMKDEHVEVTIEVIGIHSGTLLNWTIDDVDAETILSDVKQLMSKYAPKPASTYEDRWRGIYKVSDDPSLISYDYYHKMCIKDGEVR
jgi:hypothetical protein